MQLARFDRKSCVSSECHQPIREIAVAIDRVTVFWPIARHDHAQPSTRSHDSEHFSHREPRKFDVLKALSGEHDIKLTLSQLSPVVRIGNHLIDIRTSRHVDSEIRSPRCVEVLAIATVDVHAANVQRRLQLSRHRLDEVDHQSH